MKIAHFDCFSGISGDMILGALIDAGLNPNLLIKELSKLSIEGLSIDTYYAMRKSISCKQVRVKIGNKNIDFEDEHLLQLPIDKKARSSKKKNSTKQNFQQIIIHKITFQTHSLHKKPKRPCIKPSGGLHTAAHRLPTKMNYNGNGSQLVLGWFSIGSWVLGCWFLTGFRLFLRWFSIGSWLVLG